MILATVRFTLGDLVLTANLTETGWSVLGYKVLSDALNLISPLSEFGPAAGDPVACSAQKIATSFQGAIIYLRPLSDPPGTIY